MLFTGERMITIYLITNFVDGKRYVGQTRQKLSVRWYQHNHSSHCCYLFSAIQKHGKENFGFESICDVPTQELADEIETYYISRYRTLVPDGYNICLGGNARSLSDAGRRKLSAFFTGRKHTEETRKKISESRIGKHPSKETCQRISISKIGKSHPILEETRKKISKAKKGKKQSEEHRLKTANLRRGTRHTEETRCKMSKRHKGKKLSGETRKKISNARKGMQFSEETCKKISDAAVHQFHHVKTGLFDPRCILCSKQGLLVAFA
jgi:group I intron endonuclease